MPADSRRVKELFVAALELPEAAARQTFLDEACGQDAELRQHLELLLQAHDHPASILNRPLAEVVPAAASPGSELAPPPTIDQPIVERPGVVIGPYKLLEQIGEGGFGVVFLADQAEPVRRKVALKILKPGMDTRQVVARFEAERQALALMEHANIAQVHDGGTTADGRPYFVMELVRGIPLTDYCDQCSLTTRERLDLFLAVCSAVQHAHQKGVIHRDIKPSNVLVAIQDGKPMVKVIDFGVAKAINQRLSEQALVTGFHQMIGTPLYMSPEQAEMSPLDVDTRADIYALGVLLYELLTGTTPFEKERFKEASYDELRRIIREEEPPRPSARLSTLQDKLTTVAAQRRTEPRQLLRTVKGELDWIVMKALEKDRNRRYETANGFAMDVQRYLADEPVLACPPSLGYRLGKFTRRNRAALAVALLILLFFAVLGAVVGWAVRERAAQQAAFSEKVSLALTESEDYYRQGRLQEALAAAERAQDLIESGPVAHDLRGQVQKWLADLRLVVELESIRLDRVVDQAEDFGWGSTDSRYQKIFAAYGLDATAPDVEEAARRIKAAPIRADLLAALDDWLYVKDAGRLSGGEPLALLTHKLDPDSWRGQFSEAVKRRDKEAVEHLVRTYILARSPATIVLAAAYLRVRNGPQAAVDVLTKAQQQHPGDLWVNYYLALYLMQLEPPKAAEAVGYYRVALAQRPDSPGLWVNLGIALRRAGKPSEAEAAYRQALGLQPGFSSAHNNLGGALWDQNQFKEAEAEFREALRLRPNYSDALSNLGYLTMQQGRHAEAEEAFRKAVLLKPDHAKARQGLGAVYLLQSRWAEAEIELREGLRLEPHNAWTHDNLGSALLGLSKAAEAEAEFREAVRLNPKDWIPRHNLGLALLRQKKPAEAEAVLRQAIELIPDRAEFHLNLGVALFRQGKTLEAEKALRTALKLQPNNHVALYNLRQVLQSLGRADESATEGKEKPEPPRK